MILKKQLKFFNELFQVLIAQLFPQRCLNCQVLLFPVFKKLCFSCASQLELVQVSHEKGSFVYCFEKEGPIGSLISSQQKKEPDRAICKVLSAYIYVQWESCLKDKINEIHVMGLPKDFKKELERLFALPVRVHKKPDPAILLSLEGKSSLLITPFFEKRLFEHFCYFQANREGLFQWLALTN